MKVLRLVTIATCALLLGNAEPEGQEDICVEGPSWRPSLEDARQIAVAAIPASYRQLFESKEPCVRWSLNEASLIDWHLRFGDEKSTAEGLAYLERDYAGSVPPVGRYRHELERAWQSALPDLSRALAIRQPEGLNYSLQYRFMESRRPVRRLNRLIDGRDNYLLLAEQYLRAAEEFRSVVLLDKAELYLTPALEGAAFMEPLETQAPAARVLALDLDTFRTDDFRMRAAVLRAQLTLAPDDIERARTVLQSVERPIYRRAAETAFSGGDDFCDISRGWGDADKIEAACHDDDQFQDRVVNYWISRAIFDQIIGSQKERSDELAIRLLKAEQSANSGRCCRRFAGDDMYRLLSAQADYHRRQLMDAQVGQDNYELVDHWRSALNDLREAERFAPVVSNPKRFKRVAGAWLEVWGQGGKLPELNSGTYRPTTSPDLIRYAIYLHGLLGDLDAIISGEEGGPPKSS